MNRTQIIHNNVQIEREKRRVTQTELALALGVSRQTVIMLEKGDYSPSLLLALKVSRYFHEPIENLFYLKQ